MNCCNNKKVIKNKEMNFCINCGTIYDYDFVHESIFGEYNLNIDNMLQYKQGLEPCSSFFPAVFGQTVSRCST